jgi:hypothetical protein
LAGSRPKWHLAKGDVKAAFLKGDEYKAQGGELFMTAPDPRKGPKLPWGEDSQMARILKGVFGLADAPREWYLRLDRCMKEHGWTPLSSDAATWIRRGPEGKITGLIVGHVDDLLMTGDEEAWRDYLAISKELGFGSLEENDFVWCGKRIQRTADGLVRISMEAYQENLEAVWVPKSRRGDLTAPLDQAELKKFRGACGSLQWLVAQLRVDKSFDVSALQGELRAPCVGSLLRANVVIEECRRTSDFALTFGEIDWENGGLLGVSDAALGNVNADGVPAGSVDEKVHSQAGYLIFFADAQALTGEVGRIALGLEVSPSEAGGQ